MSPYNKLHEYNIDCNEALKQIDKILKRNLPYYSNTRIKCLSIKEENNWFNLLCVINIFPKNAKLNKSEKYYYRNVCLLEEDIKTNNLLSFLGRFKNEKIRIAKKNVIFGERTEFKEREFLPNNNTYFKLPGYLFTASSSLKGITFDFNQALLSHKFPFFPNIDRVIEEWFQIYDFKGNRDIRVNKVLLFLPQGKAYFGDLKYDSENNVLKIELIKNDKSISLYAKGGYKYNSEYKSFDKVLNLRNNTIEISSNIGKRIEEFEIYLIDEEGNIYDYHKESRYKVEGGERIFGKAVEHEIEDIIKIGLSSGENEYFEYKPYIKKGDTKINEIIETVIAFANTKGGYILIGVSDYVQIEGIENEIQKEARKQKKDSDIILKDYIGYVRKQISDALNKALYVEIKPHVYSGRTLLIIEVPEGKSKPYANIHTKDIFVRKGANNVKPDPETELPNLILKTRIYSNIENV